MSPAERLDRRVRKRRELPSIFRPVRKRHRPLRLADWGIEMTVCIAAISRRDSCIVAVSDLMLSSDVFSFDTQTVKCEPLSRSGKWIALYAGDPSIWTMMFDSASARIQQGTQTVEEVEAALEATFRSVLKHKIEGEMLSRFGLDRQTFIQSGLGYFGEEKFIKLVEKIEEAGLETTLLVAGFDPDGSPHVLSVEDPGVCARHANVGFHTIGTGSVLAESAMCATYNSQLSTNDLIYRLCEAKFLAEPATGVGRKTFVVVVAPDGVSRRLSPEFVELIRDIWHREGRPPVPPSTHDVIAKYLSPLDWNPSEKRKSE